jgi:oligoribonuclease
MKQTQSTPTGVPAEGNNLTPAYVWFDTEFTGLETERAHLLQVAMVITDTRLQRLALPSQDVCLCVKLDPAAPVSAWVAENLAGLLARCRSQDAMPVEEVDAILAQRVNEVVGPVAHNVKLRPVLAGNTVHMDAAMVRRFLPEFNRLLHYRLLDVSTLKTFWNDSFPGPVFPKDDAAAIHRFLPPGFTLPAANAHDAYYDIHATLAEMNYYRQQLGACRTDAV